MSESKTGSAVQALVIRLFDILLASVGLLVTAPLFPIVAVFIKLDSEGPVFFPVDRVGKGMKVFPMYKFRTMLDVSTKIDQSICAQFDPRVTAAGRLLRRTKLNELPQLLNILKGDMSFVGPRPEDPKLAAMYPEEAKVVFTVKPGLVGPVVISALKDGVSGRNEEEMYPPGVDPERYYIEHILPEKVKIDMYHLSRQTVSTYFWIILGAARETVFGVLSTRQFDRGKRQAYLFAADFVFSLLSYGIAYRFYLRTAGIYPDFSVFISGLLLLAVIRPLVFQAMGLYKIVVRLITPRDILRAAEAVLLGSLVLLTLGLLQLTYSFPWLLVLVDFVLAAGLLSGLRLALIARHSSLIDRPPADARPQAVIYGANGLGLKALRVLGQSKDSPYRIVGFIDDDENKFARKISGLKVLGNRYHIGAIAVLHNVQEVILAPDDPGRDRLEELVALCAGAGIHSRLFSGAAEDGPGSAVYPLRPLQLSDMLPQVDIPLDEAVLRSILSGRTTLMMGSGGELGSALCRHLYHLGCRKIVIVDRYRSALSRMMAGLIRDLPGFQTVPIVLDSRDMDALDMVFLKHRPQIVLHAGMRKFIPFEKTTDEEVAGANYVATFNLAKAAARHGCDYFLVISSINAERRGSFIAESLRVAEISLTRIFSPTSTRLIVNRVGNIIENAGGIVSWLNDQILQGRPIPLRSESARAFLLSKNAGARSIMQALAMGSRLSPGGLLLTSEPGVSLEYGDVARRIAGFYGIQAGFDINVDLGEIPDALLHDEPSAVKAASDLAAAVNLKNYLDSDRAADIIQSLISGDSGGLTKQEWHRRTREILALCRPTRPGPKKSLSLN